MSIAVLPPVEEEVVVTTDVILERAEAWMREHGWTRSTFKDTTGRVCLVGAVIYGAGDDTDGTYCEIAVQGMSRILGMDVTYWNDRWCRSEEEALMVLRMARTHPSKEN